MAVCGECGAECTAATSPRYCDACLSERVRLGIPITRYPYPEELFGAGDRNVRAVKAAA